MTLSQDELGQRLPRACRLKKRWEFLAVQGSGRRAQSASLVVFCRPRRGGPPRLGITVSRRVDKRAWVRNRIKRWIREAFRRQRSAEGRYDLVVIARRQATEASYQQIARELGNILKRKLRVEGPA